MVIQPAFLHYNSANESIRDEPLEQSSIGFMGGGASFGGVRKRAMVRMGIRYGGIMLLGFMLAACGGNQPQTVGELPTVAALPTLTATLPVTLTATATASSTAT